MRQRSSICSDSSGWTSTCPIYSVFQCNPKVLFIIQRVRMGFDRGLILVELAASFTVDISQVHPGVALHIELSESIKRAVLCILLDKQICWNSEVLRDEFRVQDWKFGLQGDRVGICVTQLDPSRVERGWLSAPGTVPTFTAAVAALEKIRFYTGDLKSRQKLHVTVGHVTVMAEMEFFGLPDGEGEPRGNALQAITSRIGALSAKVGPSLLRRQVEDTVNISRKYSSKSWGSRMTFRSASKNRGNLPLKLLYSMLWGGDGCFLHDWSSQILLSC